MSADQEAVDPLWGALCIKREVAGLCEHRFEYGAGFDAREGCSDAVVNAMAERQMLTRRTTDHREPSV